MQASRPWTALGIGAAGLLAGLGAVLAVVRGGHAAAAGVLVPTLLLDLAVGWSFVGVGVHAWWRRPDSRTGLLMVLLGVAWLSRDTGALGGPVATAAGVVLGSLYLGVFHHLLVGYPTGRLAGTSPRVVVGAGYLLVVPLGAVVDPLAVLVVAGYYTVLLVIVLSRHSRTSRRLRRTLGPAVWGGVVIVVAIVAYRAAVLAGLSAGTVWALRWTSEVVLVAWPAALLLGLLRSRLDRSAVSRMIVELGTGPPEPARLQSVLSATLHDPSVRLAIRLPRRGVFVDVDGAATEVGSRAEAGRAVTYVDRAGARIAALDHDVALLGEPELMAAVVAGAGLALQNEQLHAEVRAQLADVRASRSRLLDSADAARNRIERELQAGAQQRLRAVTATLRRAQERMGGPDPGTAGELLDAASAELSDALAELRELARGIYPALLTNAGLGPALETLAERSAVPAVVSAVPGRRLPLAIEQTCYFAVSEALGNAARHARAHQIVVAVHEERGRVVVEVRDDGIGGVDEQGPGLRGIADRIAALGGSLHVVSPAGGGTRVRAELPDA